MPVGFATASGSDLKVCGLRPSLLVMPPRNQYLSSSCSKSAGVRRAPCSSTTVLKPEVESSRASTPPAAPEPTTTKSTTVESR